MIEPNFICLLYRTNRNLLFGIDQQKEAHLSCNLLTELFMVLWHAYFLSFSFLTSLLW